MVRRLTAAFLGQFGELDRLVGVDDVRFIRNNFEEVQQSYQITLYKAAPHGWMDSTIAERFRPEITEASFAELAAFLEDHSAQPSATRRRAALALLVDPKSRLCRRDATASRKLIDSETARQTLRDTGGDCSFVDG